MYNYKVLIWKIEAIPPINYSIIPVDLCQNNEPVINFTTDEIRSKFEVFSKYKMDELYITEIMWI